MIESFALLTGRISQKLDDGLPEVTQSLLETLYPHYLRPFPSMAIVQFEPDLANIDRPNHSTAFASTHREDRPRRLIPKLLRCPTLAATNHFRSMATSPV